uniref:glutathione transferase n=1 Tax=Serinus canaria TaxID=9135 RepID=A0A8C9MJF5_SERCA
MCLSRPLSRAVLSLSLRALTGTNQCATGCAVAEPSRDFAPQCPGPVPPVPRWGALGATAPPARGGPGGGTGRDGFNGTGQQRQRQRQRQDGAGDVPGPALAALPGALHLRPEQQHPLRVQAGAADQGIAILLYLAQKFKTPDHWYPADLQKRARVDEYLSWQHVSIRAKGIKLFLSKVLLPLITGQPLPPEKLEFAIEELNVVLKQFEEKFLQDKPFIAGSEVSLADLVALVELMQAVCADYDLFEKRPKLAEWRRRVEEAVGKQLFLEAHQEIMNVKNLTADQFAPEFLDIVKQQLLNQN